MTDVEGAATSGKALLKSPRGKAIAAAVAGGVVYLWWSRRQLPAATAPDPAATTPIDRVVPTAGGGGGGTVSAPADARPQDNQAWLAQCVSVLSAPPYNYDSSTVYNALRLALDGQAITQAQQSIVSLAISIKGSPPEGMPPLNQTPPANTTPTPPAPPAQPAPPERPAFSLSVVAGQPVSVFTDQIHAKRGYDPEWALLEIANPGLWGNVNWGPSGSKNFAARTFKKNATYTVPAGV